MRWRLKSPTSRLFTQPFVQAHIKESMKASRHWSLCDGKPPVIGGDSPHKRPVTRKMFPFDDFIMVERQIMLFNNGSRPLAS